MVGLKKFGKTKVGELNVSLLIHEDVLRFQISVHNLISMEVTQCHKNLSADELDSRLRESPLLTKMVEDVAASDEFEEEIDSVLVLEHVVQGENEWVFGLLKNISFRFGVENLSFFNQNVLVNPLHRIFLPILGVDYVEHFSEGTFVKHFLDLKVLQLNILVYVHV